MGTRGTLPGTLLQKQGLLPSWVWSGGGLLGPGGGAQKLLWELSPSTEPLHSQVEGTSWGWGGEGLLPSPWFQSPFPMFLWQSLYFAFFILASQIVSQHLQGC